MHESSKPILRVEGVGKSFPTRSGELTVLRDVSFSLAAADGLAIMGPSGSGKSTLLHIIGTLEPPTNGRVILDEQDPWTLSAGDLARFRNTRIGFVFQDHHLLPQCSVLENVLLPTLVSSTEGALSRAKGLLERVGLSERLDHRPAELSGGERQRVALVRALINRPRIVLADEPTGNLDRVSATVIADLLVQLVGEESIGLIVVTHSESLADRFSKRMEMVDGTLVSC
ncbi:MAG: ABC transporter ATP-binding protein [Planctomycetota bacterium]